MLSEFQRDTSVELLGTESRNGERESLRYRADVRRGWEIGEISNGGYLLALVGSAMSTAVERPPLTVTAHYLLPVTPGPAEAVVRPIRVGRRLATVVATLEREGRPMLTALGTFGTAAGSEVRLVDGGPPDVGHGYDAAALPASPNEPPFPSITDRLAVRLRPGDDGYRRAAPKGSADLAGWFAFADGGPIDKLALLLAADAFAPPIFNSGLPASWVPTIELTVHVRASPAPGPLRAAFRSRFITGGMLDEDGELWDEAGNIVAQSRQLSLIPRS